MFIFIGNNLALPEITVRKNSIVADLKNCEEAFLKYARLKELFIPLKEYGEIKVKLNNPLYQKKIEEIEKSILNEVR